MDNRVSGVAKNPALDNEIYEGIFDKEDRTGIIAGLIDISILGIGIIVALLWQSGLTTHPTSVTYSNWQSSPISATNISGSVPKNTPSNIHVSVCSALVQTRFQSGKTQFVEYRGNCQAVNAIARNSKSAVRALPKRNYNVTLSGN